MFCGWRVLLLGSRDEADMTRVLFLRDAGGLGITLCLHGKDVELLELSEEDRAEELQFLRDGGLLWDQSRHKGLFKQLLSYTAL